MENKNELFIPLLDSLKEYLLFDINHSIICVEIKLPFELGLEDGYPFIVKNKKQFFRYKIGSTEEGFSSTMYSYEVLQNKAEKITGEEIEKSIEKLYLTINDMVKIMKSRFGNLEVYLLSETTRNMNENVFIFDMEKENIVRCFSNFHILSIYNPDKPDKFNPITEVNEYDYFLRALEEMDTNRATDAFYFINLAKENEFEKDYNSAVINMQTGTEIFLFFILKLFIEEKVYKKRLDIKKLSFKNLLEHHLSKIFNCEKYVFDINNLESDIGRYFKALYDLRNSLVHDGKIITYTEYSHAKESLDFLIQNLSKEINNRYPEIEFKIVNQLDLLKREDD